MTERGFEDLDCYRLALEVLKEAYALAGRLPGVERYNLSDQLRRAASSTTLNIAEGYGRYHYLDKVGFYYIARGSLTEILSAFVVCHTAGYLDEEALQRHRALCHRALQALNGLIRYTNNQKQGQKEFGNRVLREPEIEYHVPPQSPTGLPDIQSTNPEFPDHESTNYGG